MNIYIKRVIYSSGLFYFAVTISLKGGITYLTLSSTPNDLVYFENLNTRLEVGPVILEVRNSLEIPSLNPERYILVFKLSVKILNSPLQLAPRGWPGLG